MIVRVKNMIMIDTANHYVLMTEDGRLGHVREPMSGNVLGVLEVRDFVPNETSMRHDLQGIVEHLLDRTDIEFKHEGVWNNIRDTDGSIQHPFSDEQVKKLPCLKFSNYYDKYWLKWYPKEVEAKVEFLNDREADLKLSLDVVNKRLASLNSVDYSERKKREYQHD